MEESGEQSRFEVVSENGTREFYHRGRHADTPTWLGRSVGGHWIPRHGVPEPVALDTEERHPCARGTGWGGHWQGQGTGMQGRAVSAFVLPRRGATGYLSFGRWALEGRRKRARRHWIVGRANERLL